MANILVGMVPLFLHLLITSQNQEWHVEARICEAPSRLFRGVCIIDSNCAQICEKEGYLSGKCKKTPLKCICMKDCDGGPAPAPPVPPSPAPPSGGSPQPPCRNPPCISPHPPCHNPPCGGPQPPCHNPPCSSPQPSCHNPPCGCSSPPTAPGGRCHNPPQ